MNLAIYVNDADIQGLDAAIAATDKASKNCGWKEISPLTNAAELLTRIKESLVASPGVSASEVLKAYKKAQEEVVE